MIQIDVPMPESCYHCPMHNEYDYMCSVLPLIQAIQHDVRYSTEKRSKYCPLIEIPEKEHFKLTPPEKCGDCEGMLPYGEKHYCHMDAISSKCSGQDISTIFVDPESRPDWCPIMQMNGKIEEMPPDKREDFDKLMIGLSSLFGGANKLEEDDARGIQRTEKEQ